MRVVLPLGIGGVAHLFVVYGHQEAENDPEKLALTDQPLTSVLARAEMCYSGQPVVLVGDLHANSLVIPSLANGIANGAWIDVELAFANGRGVYPAPTSKFRLDENKGTRRDFAIACPLHY